MARLVDDLRKQHDAWSAARRASVPPDASVVELQARASEWCDRAVSILESAEIEHPEAAQALARIPTPGPRLGSLRDALRVALDQCLALRVSLDPDAADARFFADGDALLGRLDAALDTAQGQVQAERLDALDGEIYLMLRGLHRAAQRAFVGRDPERAARYVLQYLVTISRGVPADPVRGEG